jgi:segregation and condensation protein A
VSSPLNIQLEHYEGPLDLLLDLIRRQQINIYDIPIAQITQQYLDYLHRAMALDMELSAEFVYMAATLIHIKSRLIEHEQYRSAAAMLQEKRMIEEAIWTNPQVQGFVVTDEEPGLAVSLIDLVKTFQQVLERAKLRPMYEVSKEDVGVPDMILMLKQMLSALPKRQTLALVPLFERQRSRRAMICLFLAILEMVKQQAIHLTQAESFGEINIRRDDRFDEMLAADEDAARIEQEYKS